MWRGSGRLSAKKTEDVTEKTEDVAKKAEDVCDKFAPISQVVGTRVAQLFAQAGELSMV